MFRITSRLVKPYIYTSRFSSTTITTSSPSIITQFDLYNPTEEHGALRTMVREFVESEVDPQALQYNREEKFNVELFRKLGNKGLLDYSPF